MLTHTDLETRVSTHGRIESTRTVVRAKRQQPKVGQIPSNEIFPHSWGDGGSQPQGTT